MLFILGLLIYGLFVGGIAKVIHPISAPVGWLPTIAVGLIGSYVGGFIQFLIGRAPLGSPSGLFWGIVGGVVALIVWRAFTLATHPTGPKSFWTGK